MIPGITIAMGGRDWLVPPLTLGQLRRLMPKVRQLTEMGAPMGEAQIGVLVEIVATALQRNYPDATVDMVENLVSFVMKLSVSLVKRVSGPSARTGNGRRRRFSECANLPLRW